MRKPGLIVLALVGALLLVVAAIFAVDYVRYSGYAERASKIQAGMTRNQVRQIMGEPPIQMTPDSYGGPLEHPIWIYGRTFTLKDAFLAEPPFFFPIRIRFEPESDDVWILFDEDNGAVLEVHLPTATK